MLLKARRYRFDFSSSRRVRVMGVLNITPDSFSDGARYLKTQDAYERALELAAQGADIIDMGAESTRPGSAGVSARQQLQRIVPVLKKVTKKVRVPISIDTRSSEVADECLRAGAAIINDISGLKHDGRMASVVKKYKAGLIIMHMRGGPATMQSCVNYVNLMRELTTELEERVRCALNSGIERERIVIDPGIGFAKTVEQNLEILRSLKKLHSFKRPILLGTSRKSFIGKTLNRDVHERQEGTLASLAYAFFNGVNIVRVHEVRETKDFITMMHAINNAH